jgi:hypothetical protein
MAVQFIRETRDLPSPLRTAALLMERQQEFDKARHDWEARSAVIGTKLEAYFPETEVPSDWTRFSQVVTEFCELERADSAEHDRRIARLREALTTFRRDQSFSSEAWHDIRNEILEVKADIIRHVLREDIRVFRTEWLSSA